MTDHIHTPYGIKNGKGSAKYNGDDAVVVQLLEKAIAQGADIKYDHSYILLSEQGYAEGDDYDYLWGGGGSYTWVEATERDL